MNIERIVELTCELNFNNPQDIKRYIIELDLTINSEKDNLIENLSISEEIENISEENKRVFKDNLKKEYLRKTRFLKDQVFSLEKLLKSFDIGYQFGQTRVNNLKRKLEDTDFLDKLKDISSKKIKNG